MVAVVVVVFAECPFGDSVTFLQDIKSWNGGATAEETEERTLVRPLLDWH
jgi:hypothetical protein